MQTDSEHAEHKTTVLEEPKRHSLYSMCWQCEISCVHQLKAYICNLSTNTSIKKVRAESSTLNLSACD